MAACGGRFPGMPWGSAALFYFSSQAEKYNEEVTMRIVKAVLTLFLALWAGSAVAADKEFKVGFIYVSPVGDAGWSYSQDLGRQALEAF